jgi:hypothetical protein
MKTAQNVEGRVNLADINADNWPRYPRYFRPSIVR